MSKKQQEQEGQTPEAEKSETLEKVEKTDKKAEKKERKVKVVYYDDGSTVADMSRTRREGKQKSTFREKMQTFFAVMKKMVLPMLCTIAAFGLIYLFLLFFTGRL